MCDFVRVGMVVVPYHDIPPDHTTIAKRGNIDAKVLRSMLLSSSNLWYSSVLQLCRLIYSKDWLIVEYHMQYSSSRP